MVCGGGREEAGLSQLFMQHGSVRVAVAHAGPDRREFRKVTRHARAALRLAQRSANPSTSYLLSGSAADDVATP